MHVRRLAPSVAALAMGSVAVLGLASPAAAQEATPSPGEGVVYPPEDGAAEEGEGAGASDSTVVAGQEITVSTGQGTFTPGTSVTVTISPGGTSLGTVTAAGNGAATITFTVPALSPGEYSVVFTGVDDGAAATESIGFTVQAAAAGVVTNPRPGVLDALPRTGADQFIPLAASGVALIAVGTAAVVVARRRSSDLEGTQAG